MVFVVNVNALFYFSFNEYANKYRVHWVMELNECFLWFVFVSFLFFLFFSYWCPWWYGSEVCMGTGPYIPEYTRQFSENYLYPSHSIRSRARTRIVKKKKNARIPDPVATEYSSTLHPCPSIRLDIPEEDDLYSSTRVTAYPSFRCRNLIWLYHAKTDHTS